MGLLALVLAISTVLWPHITGSQQSSLDPGWVQPYRGAGRHWEYVVPTQRRILAVADLGRAVSPGDEFATVAPFVDVYPGPPQAFAEGSLRAKYPTRATLIG